jgi:DNA modification methylase
MKITELKLNPENPQKFKKKDLKKLKNSISEFPKMMELRPLVFDPETMFVLGGNKRLICIQELGMEEIPDTWIKSAADLTEEEKKRFIIADNVGFGEWDFEMLGEMYEIENLEEWGIDISNINITEEAEEDDYEIPDEIETNIVLGDLIEIGEHRLLCGDSTDSEQVAKLMGGEKADMVFTDPPYSVNYTKKAKEVLKSKNYVEIKNDNLSVEETAEMLWRPTFKNLYDNSKDDCSFYVTMPQGGDQMMMMMMMNENWQVKHELIWVKEAPVFSMGRLDYDYKHEPIMYGWKNKHNFYGKGSFLKSIWEIPRKENKLHPTMKPIQLIGNAILNSSLKNNIITDLFLGSGSTMVAAHQLNRKCYGMELDPKYCQVIVDRMHKLDPDLSIKINGKPIDL